MTLTIDRKINMTKNRKKLSIAEYFYLSLIYYYSFYSLNASIFSYNNGEMPTFFLEFIPFLGKLIKTKNSDYNVSDRSILIYFIMIDLIRKPIVPFSKIVKFNIVLTYLIEFSLIIVSQMWEIFTTRDIIIVNEQFREEGNIHDPFYSIVWAIYAIIYLYCFIAAFQAKYPKFLKPFNKITASIQVYLSNKQSSNVN